MMPRKASQVYCKEQVRCVPKALGTVSGARQGLNATSEPLLEAFSDVPLEGPTWQGPTSLCICSHPKYLCLASLPHVHLRFLLLFKHTGPMSTCVPFLSLSSSFIFPPAQSLFLSLIYSFYLFIMSKLPLNTPEHISEKQGHSPI